MGDDRQVLRMENTLIIDRLLTVDERKEERVRVGQYCPIL